MGFVYEFAFFMCTKKLIRIRELHVGMLLKRRTVSPAQEVRAGLIEMSRGRLLPLGCEAPPIPFAAEHQGRLRRFRLLRSRAGASSLATGVLSCQLALLSLTKRTLFLLAQFRRQLRTEIL